jgi:hypothetical protein
MLLNLKKSQKYIDFIYFFDSLLSRNSRERIRQSAQRQQRMPVLRHAHGRDADELRRLPGFDSG